MIIVPAEHSAINTDVASKERYPSEEEWRVARRSGLGGSDISVLMGVNQYSTYNELIANKLYGNDKWASNAMAEGVLLEPLVIKYFSETLQGKKFSRIERNKELFRRNDMNYALATPDAFLIVDDNDGYGILEIKTAHFWSARKREMAEMQVQWYLFVTGAQFGYIACLEQRTKMHIHGVLRDENLIAEMVRRAEIFWNELQELHGKN